MRAACEQMLLHLHDVDEARPALGLLATVCSVLSQRRGEGLRSSSLLVGVLQAAQQPVAQLALSGVCVLCWGERDGGEKDGERWRMR